jgi:hypothetical protein
MKARKKAGVIEVQRFARGTVQVWPPAVRFAADPGTEMVRVWNAPQQTWVGVNDGDYVRIDDPADVYPIAPEYFAANFDVVPDEVPA